MADLRNYVLLVDKQGKEVLPVTDGKAVFVGDGSVKLNDQLTSLEGQISTNASEIARVEGEYKAADALLEGRVGTLESDKADKTQVALDIAGAKQELQTEIDKKVNADALGDVAYKSVGTAEGNIPVLGANGKLDESVIPSIAINEHFDAENEDAAMLLTVQNGDVVYVTDKGVSYLCVNASEVTFEKRFRPLTSAADFITKAEVESKLANKVDNATFEGYKSEVQGKLDTKVESSTLEAYKLEVEGKLNEKATVADVGGVSGLQTTAKVVVDAINEVKVVADGAEAKATQNASDLANYKEEVTNALAGKSDVGHTHDQYALKTEVEAVESKVDANTSAIATKADQTALEELGGQLEGCIRFRVFDIESEDLKLA